jgi:hypothetical protein
VLLLIGQVVIANGDLWVVAALIPSDAGSYAAVALVGRLVFIAGWSIVTVVFPSLASGSEEANGRLLLKAVCAAALAGGTLSVGAFVAGDRLIGAMVGDDYAAAGHLLGPYALATTLFVVANLLAVSDLAAGRRLLPALVAAGAIAQTVLLVLMAPRGITWIVYGQLVAMAVLAVVLASALVTRLARPGRAVERHLVARSRRPATPSQTSHVRVTGSRRPRPRCRYLKTYIIESTVTIAGGLCRLARRFDCPRSPNQAARSSPEIEPTSRRLLPASAHRDGEVPGFLPPRPRCHSIVSNSQVMCDDGDETITTKEASTPRRDPGRPTIG